MGITSFFKAHIDFDCGVSHFEACYFFNWTFNSLPQSKVENQQKVISEADSSQTVYLDQIEDLTYKLTQAEAKLKDHETSRLEDGAKVG